MKTEVRLQPINKENSIFKIIAKEGRCIAQANELDINDANNIKSDFLDCHQVNWRDTGYGCKVPVLGRRIAKWDELEFIIKVQLQIEGFAFWTDDRYEVENGFMFYAVKNGKEYEIFIEKNLFLDTMEYLEQGFIDSLESC